MSSAGTDLPMILYWLRSLSLTFLKSVGVSELPIDLGLLQDLAVADGAPGGLVDDATAVGVAVGELGAQQLGAGLGERDPAQRAGARDAVELGRDAAAVHRVGQAVHSEVVHALERGVEPHLVPRYFQLVGDDLREGGADVLPHLGLDDVHGGGAVGGHGEPDGRLVGRGGGHRGLRLAAAQAGRDADAQECAPGDRGRAHQELAAGHALLGRVSHGSSPS